ncbi:MAG: nucleoside monophosphate kinase [Nanoarchaeota archaeon]|nr:nucleoside monophosphate kinase [Nanoarchaeota archaeon]
MKLIFLGPPNSGKGTYAKRIAERTKTTYISSSGLFRDAADRGMEFGKKAMEYINLGRPVPNEMAIGVLIERLNQPDCANGFIFDTPYNADQAKEIDKNEKTKIDVAINVTVPEEILIRRGASRVACKKCGTTYNLLTVPPKKEGVCDKCDGELYQREDDKKEKIIIRLEEYRIRAGPLEEYYKNTNRLEEVKWDKELIPEGGTDVPIEDMIKQVMDILERLKSFQIK